MKVYHGSDILIKTIDLNKCKFGKDFGRGFYVTKHHEQAVAMSERISRWSSKEPVVTEFEFKEYIYTDSDFNTLRFDGYTEQWLDFIILNRKNEERKQVHDYDIIEGPVANDDIAARIFDYLAGTVSKKNFLNELKFKMPTHQICFCTVQSLQALSFQETQRDASIMHIDNNIIRTLITDFKKTETEATDIYYKSKTYSRIADENSDFYKKPWLEIYQILLDEIKKADLSA